MNRPSGRAAHGAPPQRTPMATPMGTVAAFSASGFMYGALATPLAVYLPNYYASRLGMAMGAVGAVFLLVKLLDIGFDPLLGLMMDRTRTRFGRYRVWLLLAAPILSLGGAMTFLAPKGVGPSYLLFWLAVLYVGYSLVILAPAAWGAVLARTYHDRSRLFAWSQFVAVSGAVLVLLLPSLIAARLHAPAAGVRLMGWLIVVAAPLTILVAAIGAPEPRTPRVKDGGLTFKDYMGLALRPDMLRLIACDFALSFGPGFTAPLYLFFFQQARGYTATEANLLLLLYIVAGLAGAPAWGALARRFGKHRTLMGACATYSLAQAGLMILPKADMTLMAPGMFAAGFVASAFVFLIRAMVADVGDAVRLETGKERTGMLYAFVSSTLKIGAALAVGVTFTLLSKIGFNPAPGAHNTAAAIHGLELCYVAVPIAMALAGALVLIGYRLDEAAHGRIRTALDTIDATAARAPVADIPGRVPGPQPGLAARIDPAVT